MLLQSQDRDVLDNTLSELGYTVISELRLLEHGANSDNYVITLKDGSKLLAKYYKIAPNNPERGFEILSRLYDHGISVPQQLKFVPATEETRDLLLMDYIEGQVMQDVVRGNTDHQLWKDYIEIIANLHLLDWKEILPSFTAHPNYPEMLYNRRLAFCKNNGLLSETSNILNWLEERVNFKVDHFSILHGDLHPLNVIVRDNDGTSELVLLDWEGIDVGDNRRDLAFTLLTTGFLQQIDIDDKLLNYYRQWNLPTDRLDFYMVSEALQRLIAFISKPIFDASNPMYNQAFKYLKNKLEEITSLEFTPRFA